MASPLSLSVIMANRNGAAYLRPSLASVLAQTHRDLELILSDDASTDDSLGIARSFSQSDGRLRILSSSDAQGPSAARNRALAVARGDWIAIVDSDDLMHPARFGRMLQQAVQLDVDILADDQVYFGANLGHTLLETRSFHAPWQISAREYLAAELSSPPVPVGYLKPIIRRSALGGLRYDETLKIGEDFDLIFRLLLNGLTMAVLPEAYYLYRRHSNSTSHRLQAEDCEGMIRVCAGYLEAAPRDLAPLVRQRLRMHQMNKSFAELVSQLKSGSVGQAAMLLTRNPSLLVSLARSLAERLSRSAPSRPVKRTEQAISLLDCNAEGRGEGFAPDALPGDAGGWTPARVAALIARAGQGNARLQAKGREGLHALGFVPGWTSAELLPPDEGWTELERERIAAFPWPVALQ